MADLYSSVIRPIFFRLDAEDAHHFALKALQVTMTVPGLLRLLFGRNVPPRDVTVCGIPFRNPVGLAAGMDKNAIALPAWEELGFGFVEVGTITAVPQPGNPRPRLFRYPAQQALINRFGFNNDGSEAIAARLDKLRNSDRWPNIPVGINIGKSKVTPLEEAALDYRVSFERLRNFGDYFVVNISSPNTPGLRDLQAIASVREIMTALREVDDRKPIFVKLAPEISENQLDDLCAAAAELGISGWIATNTTLDHSSIPPNRDQQGGLSGFPLAPRSLAVLQALRSRTNLPIIASGGIMDPASATERISAGANLVQIYTSFIYRGPSIIPSLVAA